mmetsp:Transcript_17319/g.35881  ORF Transcript_17319/g.35881 Transcript_17319/m.35881 type:complete len:692 (-) Transcript_17319:356-2431(-)|eukprot:CAMPEP_0172458438 /NCGR_PEP_ID=MMETSP1065-20121228/27544_1 /TAXON_ID=265537 /ORGANISM="Amphiprora paludosa, Strain CCMP125" /LENGTH=691 /DNA_ID=CAMNT_0013212695 /DNA_START=129 /DNA_END=2204 /DNA_ORIENTATION=+
MSPANTPPSASNGSASKKEKSPDKKAIHPLRGKKSSSKSTTSSTASAVKSSKSPPSNSKKIILPWEVKIKALRRYRDLEGECNVPQAYVDPQTNFRLGRWVANVRQRMDFLTSTQLADLNALGFVWTRYKVMPWNAKLELLQRYQKLNGDCLVSKDYVCPESGFRLGGWVDRLRQTRSSLNKTRVQDLENLGFVWNAYENHWENMFALLKEYKEEFGHVCPRSRLEYKNKPLGQWVAVQRSIYSRGRRQQSKLAAAAAAAGGAESKKEPAVRAVPTDNGPEAGGDPTAPGNNNATGMSQERQERLESLGFQWHMRKSSGIGGGIKREDVMGPGAKQDKKKKARTKAAYVAVGDDSSTSSSGSSSSGSSGEEEEEIEVVHTMPGRHHQNASSAARLSTPPSHKKRLQEQQERGKKARTVTAEALPMMTGHSMLRAEERPITVILPPAAAADRISVEPTGGLTTVIMPPHDHQSTEGLTTVIMPPTSAGIYPVDLVSSSSFAAAGGMLHHPHHLQQHQTVGTDFERSATGGPMPALGAAAPATATTVVQDGNGFVVHHHHYYHPAAQQQEQERRLLMAAAERQGLPHHTTQALLLHRQQQQQQHQQRQQEQQQRQQHSALQQEAAYHRRLLASGVIPGASSGALRHHHAAPVDLLQHHQHAARHPPQHQHAAHHPPQRHHRAAAGAPFPPPRR